MSCPIKSMRKNERHWLKSQIMFSFLVYTFDFKSKQQRMCAKREGTKSIVHSIARERVCILWWSVRFEFFHILIFLWFVGLHFTKFTTVSHKNDSLLLHSVCIEPMCLSNSKKYYTLNRMYQKLYQVLVYGISRLNACFVNDEHYRLWSSWWSIIHGLQNWLVQSYWCALEI